MVPTIPAQIERVAAGDAAAQLPQFIELLRDGVEAGASIGFLRPLKPTAGEQYWQSVFAEVASGARILLAARCHKQLVGSVQLSLCPRENGRHRAEVQKLMVHTKARKRGIGRTLMVAIENEARLARRTLLYLDTEPGQPAERMYENLGWIKAGVIPDYACNPDGELHGTTIFYRAL